MSSMRIASKLSLIDRYMLTACALYIVAFLFLTRTMTFGAIEYGVLALALLSIAVAAAKALTPVLDRHAVLVEIAQWVVAGFIAVRYGLGFVTDLNRFATLLLFVATVAFAAVFVVATRGFIDRMSRASTADAAARSEGERDSTVKP